MHLVSLGVLVLTLKLLSPCVNQLFLSFPPFPVRHPGADIGTCSTLDPTARKSSGKMTDRIMVWRVLKDN